MTVLYTVNTNENRYYGIIIDRTACPPKGRVGRYIKMPRTLSYKRAHKLPLTKCSHFKV